MIILSKTDKELTVEVVNNFVLAHSNNGCTPNDESVLKLLKDVYGTITSLRYEK